MTNFSRLHNNTSCLTHYWSFWRRYSEPISWLVQNIKNYTKLPPRCFAVAGPKLLHSLPADLRQADISFQNDLSGYSIYFCSGAEIVAHVTNCYSCTS